MFAIVLLPVYLLIFSMSIMAWDKMDVLWRDDNGYFQNWLDIKLQSIVSYPESGDRSYNTLPVNQYIPLPSQAVSNTCSKHFTPELGDLSELINDVETPCVFYAQPGIYFISDTIRLTNQTLVAEPSGFGVNRETKESSSLFRYLSERTKYSHSFAVSLEHSSLGYITADAWYQQNEVKLDKIIIVPVTDSLRRQKEWVHLQNNSQLSDVILVHSAVTDDRANDDIAKNGFTGIVSDFSSNTLGETGYLTMNDNWLSFLKTESRNGDKSNNGKGQAGDKSSAKKRGRFGSLRRSFRRISGRSFSGGSGGNGRDDEDGEDKKNKLTGHMNSIWDIIPRHVVGLDKLLMVLKALLAYLFIPGATPEEFINRLVHVIDYLQHSVANESEEVFMDNMLIQLGGVLDLNLISSMNRDDLLNQLNSHTETINTNILQRGDGLNEIIQSLLTHLVWRTSSEGGQMLVSIQRLLDNAATADISPLKHVKETIDQNQKEIIKSSERERQKGIKDKLQKMGIKTENKSDEEILLSLFRKFLIPEQGQIFFTGKGGEIIKILSEILGNEKIDQLSVRLGLGQSYLFEEAYESLVRLMVDFFKDKGNSRRLVQALNDVLGEGMRKVVNRIKEAVTEVPPLDIERVLGPIVISSPASHNRPTTSEASLPETGSNRVFLQSAREQVIEEIERFLSNNRAEDASSEPLNSQAMDQLTGLLSSKQVLQLHAFFRADDPWAQRDSQHDPENLSVVIRAILMSSPGGVAFRKLAQLLYQILGQTMKAEDIGLLLKDHLKGFQYSSA